MAGEDTEMAIVAQTGKASVLVVEMLFQELLYKGWPRWQDHSAGRQFSGRGRWLPAAFSLM